MATDLKPCPFCGGKGECVDFLSATPDWYMDHVVQCLSCGAMASKHRQALVAEQHWNRRATDGD